MGNLCFRLVSTTVFGADPMLFNDPVNHPMGALGLVDPNGFGSCAAAVDFFNEEDCVPSTAGLACVLELPDGDRPDRIDLCAGTDIWVANFHPGASDRPDVFLDLTGIEEIRCQDENCRFLKPKPFFFSFCPFVLNDVEEQVEIKDSSFLEFELSGEGLPDTVEGFDEFLKSGEESVFACQSALVSGEGLIEEIKVEDGDIRRPKSTKSTKTSESTGKRALRASSSSKRAKLPRGSPRAGQTSDQTLPASPSRELFPINDDFDAALVRVWHCMNGDLDGSLTLSIDAIAEKKACILNY